VPVLFSGSVLLMLVGIFAGTADEPGRFPVTRFEVPDEKPAATPTVVVLDDCDEDFQRDRPHRDSLRILQVSQAPDQASVKSIINKEFNTCETIGAIHCVSVDSTRGRIYVSELANDRVTALDFRGRRLWQVAKIAAGALAVDPKTGRLWCTVGHNLERGETVVLDGMGQMVASFPVRGVDIAYDPHTDGFWLVGNEITKLSREGKVLFQQPCSGWAFVSVAVNRSDGSVWIVERAHPDVLESVNRIWHRDADGGVLKVLAPGTSEIFGVACDPRTGTVWVTSFGSDLLRFTARGDALRPLPVKSRAIAVSPTTGRVWLTTETEVLWFDETDRPHTVLRYASPSGQSWLAAF
jgi:DNA-binding beta-propeller fold protein YncE